VGRLGLEPRTHGLKEDRCTAPSALPALTSREYARKAHTAQRVCQDSFHEPFHDIHATPGRFVTESSRDGVWSWQRATVKPLAPVVSWAWFRCLPADRPGIPWIVNGFARWEESAGGSVAAGVDGHDLDQAVPVAAALNWSSILPAPVVSWWMVLERTRSRAMRRCAERGVSMMLHNANQGNLGQLIGGRACGICADYGCCAVGSHCPPVAALAEL
jgi:hypothetical protein